MKKKKRKDANVDDVPHLSQANLIKKVNFGHKTNEVRCSVIVAQYCYFQFRCYL